MNLPLSYRIVSTPSTLAPRIADGLQVPLDLEAWRRHTAAEAQLICRAVNFNLDNVAEYYAMSPQQDWELKDMPNLAPPYRQMFFEWTDPKTWLMHGVVKDIEPALQGMQFGVFCMAVDVTDQSRGDLDSWLNLIYGFCAMHPRQVTVKPDERKILTETLQEARWVLCLSCWFSAPYRPICGSTRR